MTIKTLIFRMAQQTICLIDPHHSDYARGRTYGIAITIRFFYEGLSKREKTLFRTNARSATRQSRTYLAFRSS